MSRTLTPPPWVAASPVTDAPAEVVLRLHRRRAHAFHGWQLAWAASPYGSRLRHAVSVWHTDQIDGRGYRLVAVSSGLGVRGPNGGPLCRLAATDPAGLRAMVRRWRDEDGDLERLGLAPAGMAVGLGIVAQAALDAAGGVWPALLAE